VGGIYGGRPVCLCVLDYIGAHLGTTTRSVSELSADDGLRAGVRGNSSRPSGSLRIVSLTRLPYPEPTTRTFQPTSCSVTHPYPILEFQAVEDRYIPTPRGLPVRGVSASCRV